MSLKIGPQIKSNQIYAYHPSPCPHSMPLTPHPHTVLPFCSPQPPQALSQGICQVAYACTLHPGHHTGTNTYGGYCYINNAAVAVAALLDLHPKVAVIDLDYHHGNGTQEIFYSRADVFTASIHITPGVDYPFYSGIQGRGPSN